MAAIVQEEEGVSLNAIMKQQLSNHKKTGHDDTTRVHDFLAIKPCDNPLDGDFPPDDLYWFAWRRALIHFALERGERHFEDGRLWNLFLLAQGRRLPSESSDDHDAWGSLVANVDNDPIVLTAADDGFLCGRVSEEVWARTALTLRTAGHAHRKYAPTWTKKQGGTAVHDDLLHLITCISTGILTLPFYCLASYHTRPTPFPPLSITRT
jgi:hypothetical protein